MLGHSHALSGFTVGAASLPLLPATRPAEQVAWVVAVGGFAMLPDLDTGGITTRTFIPRLHGSTVARMWGPITCLAASGLSKVARGHRNGTHDALIAPAVFGLLAWAATLWFPATLVVLALAIGLALESLAFAIPGRIEETWWSNLALSFGGAWLLLTTGDGSPGWLPVAVAVGCLVHIAGDWLTRGGVPVPLTVWVGTKRRVAAHLFKTGAPIERYLVAPVFLIAACGLVWLHTGGTTPGDMLATIERTLP